MKQIVECVPNLSEGRDQNKIREIAAVVPRPGVKLLDVSSDPDHNRSVITFAGRPGAVMLAAFRLIKKTAALIDMAGHSGKHPRLGAVDVCPFIPVTGTTPDYCAQLAYELGDMVGRKLNLSGYYYGAAARCPERKKLSDIRQGEYEGLSDKLKKAEWRPDFGPAVFNPKFGCTVIGARNFLIAYNVNLDSRDMALANGIARLLRSSGGISVIGTDKRRIPGIFPSVQAIGVELAARQQVQVSMNLMDYSAAPVYIVFETVKRMASLAGVRVAGSEIVGLAPESALNDVPFEYLQLENFNPKKQIIEEALGL
ncbi:glutamate formimidoyltransferase [Candidatus Falkowbacteria bacterium RIFOXYB2_FULL_47_14]|uniref:glutamate formimidoyltransferase n=1 Tax=Candidatus Falkowbacteria bacterium RIFOXYA2_FULL_47_19 TaxID=1797994 RepID=A0A1F5SH13_9BACT|nr:MAG: glutamate formimidoyltransferase [Candidatus Falkowbacteria bacterium RIFOXYA2_FULL_47_19]OGF34495.1 MAG: glutamate formimidoyltransferase [Candidatus Falkowbacteria bacterium RIFOXYC2_FULL_46_15]OGF43533.1 MAG: glutamate formimidoyltransferase [Candidatus Falkowbacteria bacterium RIFOXYB2_FULL_47_14]